MTIRAWLASRTPAAPAALAARVLALLDADLDAPESELPERSIAAAERLVRGMLDADRTGRDSALDLLAADALVTYAFEAAAGDPQRLTQRARAALDSLSALA